MEIMLKITNKKSKSNQILSNKKIPKISWKDHQTNLFLQNSCKINLNKFKNSPKRRKILFLLKSTMKARVSKLVPANKDK